MYRKNTKHPFITDISISIIIQTQHLNTVRSFIYFSRTCFGPIYSAIIRQKHKYIIGKVR
jgi:hypothetical protein